MTGFPSAPGLALVLGYLAHRLRAPPLVGYLVARILIGPATPGYVADMELTTELAEIGVMLMMFGVGLHFSIRDLMAVQRTEEALAISMTGDILEHAAGVVTAGGHG
jgi:CPA2 family monovalent cation:H+ antiporter-2